MPAFAVRLIDKDVCSYPWYLPCLIPPRPCPRSRHQSPHPQVVIEDIRALLAKQELPYQGFDMFEGESHNIKERLELGE